MKRKIQTVHLSFQPVYSIWIHKLKRMKLNSNSTRSSFISTCVFHLNTQVEENSIELEFNFVELRNFTQWNSTWMKKFHGVKFNLNEIISLYPFVIRQRLLWSQLRSLYQRFNEFPSTCSSFNSTLLKRIKLNDWIPTIELYNSIVEFQRSWIPTIELDSSNSIVEFQSFNILNRLNTTSEIVQVNKITS